MFLFRRSPVTLLYAIASVVLLIQTTPALSSSAYSSWPSVKSVIGRFLKWKVAKSWSKSDETENRFVANRRSPLSNHFKHLTSTLEKGGGDPGKPLFLTPMIEKGKIDQAQKASSVWMLGVQGYAGFITVNQSCNSNMFFWYFPAKEADPKKAPLLLWLQGGPGGSSLFGLFTENGPYSVDDHHNLFSRDDNGAAYWSSKYSVVYVDNPVGTGFSFTDKDECYARFQMDVAQDLYSFFQQFYKLFPYLQNVPFYPTGESYAGKYVPAITYKIMTENKHARAKGLIKIPLAGMAIGDGFTDPLSMVQEYAPLLYYVGLLSENERDQIANMFREVIEKYNSGDHLGAFQIFDEALNSDLTPYPSYFTNCTGGTDYFNYARTTEPASHSYYTGWLNTTAARRNIHVGNLTYHDGSTVEKHMLPDFLIGYSKWVDKILDANYKVLFYNGNNDVIVGTPLTERLLWSKLDWKVNPTDPEVAGYVRNARNLWQVAIRNAGHMAPADQPRACFDLIDRFIQGKL